MSTLHQEDTSSQINHLTPYHAKYYAHELTKRCSSNTVEKLAASLSDAQVDLNPHQVEAALFAFKSPLSKGAILADEVGLGKTIEAGLVIAQKWAEMKRKILIIVPANLRNQWNQELLDKFFLPSVILETKSFNQEVKNGNLNPFVQKDIVICTYQFARTKDAYIKQVQWDLVVIDEAHRLRNVYKTSNKIANAIKNAVSHAPKVLLTATPLQNSLMELYGLVSLIDDFTFGDVKSFRSQYARLTSDDSFNDLKERLKPICKRTLRRQVLEYINYTNRISLTQPFSPTPDEERLYNLVSEYLQSPNLFALPSSQRQLMTLLLRKLLASSTYAITGTLEALANKLEGNLKADGQEQELDLSEEYESFDELQDEWEEAEEEPEQSEERIYTAEEKRGMTQELHKLREFEALAKSIQKNSKGEVLLQALEQGFSKLEELGGPRKAIIFTESTRTQKYLKDILEGTQYKGQVVLFNGSNTDADSKEIYKQWLEKHQGTDKVSGSKTSDVRASLVDYFRNQATIMIATEAAAEGINLQFCSLLINYDLPWNPQRIEQRIGRCHRYGQKYDVVVVNFLNTKNAADQRVYDLLDQKFKLFSGVFGASDEVLGTIASGVDVEKDILNVLQNCRTPEAIQQGFDSLQEKYAPKIDESLQKSRKQLLENFDEEVHEKLRINLEQSKHYLDKYEQWLWLITRYFLEGYAKFDYGENAFMLVKNPFEGEKIHSGPYRMGKHVEDANIYRIGHPLAQKIIAQCKGYELTEQELVFDYTNTPKKITILEDLIGKSGWLIGRKITVKSFETEDHVFLIGKTDDDVLLTEPQCQRLFSLPASEGPLPRNLNGNRDKALEKLGVEFERLMSMTLDNIGLRNGEFFEQELEKLDKWSEDQRNTLKLTLKELDDEIKELKKQARFASALPEKLKLEKERQQKEHKRDEAWREYDHAAKEIGHKKDELIDAIESRLKQDTQVEDLFFIKWKVI
jgi:ERCC4-related helicase